MSLVLTTIKVEYFSQFSLLCTCRCNTETQSDS